MVDNASLDSSLDHFAESPITHIIRNPTNVGFAAACNIGIHASYAPFLLFLNPDCFFQPGAMVTLLAGLKSDDRVGMVGGLLVNADGSEQGVGRRALPTGASGRPVSPNDAVVMPYWIRVAPIWVLPDYFPLIKASGARRVVALSSTSRFTKVSSGDMAENAIAKKLIESEARVQAWAEDRGIEWVVLRPTLIYGHGRDKNISEMARFIHRFGFFPLLGRAQGLRQPIHAEDVAAACVAALQAPAATNRAYNISGGETLAYRDMVARVFSALGRPARLLTVPLWSFRLAVAVLRCLPRYRQWSAVMAERMNRDLVFDHTDAARDLGFKPRGFALAAEDVLQ